MISERIDATGTALRLARGLRLLDRHRRRADDAERPARRARRRRARSWRGSGRRTCRRRRGTCRRGWCRASWREKRPAGDARIAIVATLTPDFVSTVAVTRAARVSVTPACDRLLAAHADDERAARELREAERVVDREPLARRRGAAEVVGGRDVEPPAALGRRRRARPCGSAVRAGRRPGYVPGCCCSVSVKAGTPSGRDSVAVTSRGGRPCT